MQTLQKLAWTHLRNMFAAFLNDHMCLQALERFQASQIPTH